MKIPTIVKDLVIAIQVFLICFLLFKNCGNKKISLNDNVKILETYNQHIQKFQTVLNNKNQQIATQNQNLISKDKEIEKALLKNSNLTELNEQIKIESKTKIEAMAAQYAKDINFCLDSVTKMNISSTGDTSYTKEIDTVGVKFGTKFYKKDKWVSIYGTIKKKEVIIDSMYVTNSYQITIGKKLGKSKVELLNENPYTKTISLGNIKIIEDKKWYQSGWIKFGAGFLLGAVGTYYIEK